ncbi:MAG: class I SAM-dependent methyltransferase [Anaerolineae bacterium]
MLEDSALRVEENLAERADALEYIGFAEQVLTAEARRYGATEDYRGLRRALKTLAQELETVDHALFDRMRHRIRTGELRGDALRQRLDAFTDYRPGNTDHRHLSFDTLDAVINGLLLGQPVPDPTVTLTPEMISYQATPGSVILELVDRVDVNTETRFFDIGSGLGKVPLLVHLLTGATVVGIELDAALCGYARAQAQRLGLDTGKTVRFVTGDAREVNYTSGDVFYLFTPFTGTILRAVLDKLARDIQARKRQCPIWICTHGPCTPAVAEVAWLRNVDGNADDPFKLAVFRSR